MGEDDDDDYNDDYHNDDNDDDDDDDDDKDDSYSNGEQPNNSTTEEIQDEQEATEEEDIDNVPIESLTVPKLKKKCKKLRLKASGTRKELIARIQRELGENSNIDYMYTKDHEGNRLWPYYRNPYMEEEEFISRMRLIADNNLHMESTGAEWNAAFPEQGLNMKAWYKKNQHHPTVKNKEEFYLDVVKYSGLTGRQMGDGIQKYNNYCMAKYGRTFPLPARGTEAWNIMYQGRYYEAYVLAHAVSEMRAYVGKSGKSDRCKAVAQTMLQILKDKFNLVDTYKGDVKGIGREYLEFWNVSNTDSLMEHPDVVQTKNEVLAIVNGTYVVEARSCDLLVRLQSEMIRKAVEVVTPNELESLPKTTQNPGYCEVIDMLRRMGHACPDCPPPLPLTEEEDALTIRLLNLRHSKHCLSLDHNNMMGMWVKKELFGGRSPSLENFDNLVATYGICCVINWLAQKQQQQQKDGKQTVWGMEWTLFFDELSGGCQACVATNKNNGTCALILMCNEDHKRKDSRRLRTSHRIHEINQDITDELKVSFRIDAFSGKTLVKDDLAGVSSHHPFKCCPLLVKRYSSSIAVLVDMRKEGYPALFHIRMNKRDRKGEIERRARETAITKPVGENLHHFWHLKVENGRVDIGKHSYDEVDGVVVVDADLQQEFAEIFDLCGAATELLVIEVRKANGKAVSIAPLVFDTSNVSEIHQSFAKHLFKLSKADLDKFIQEDLKKKCPGALDERPDQVMISVALVSQNIFNDLKQPNPEATDSSSAAKLSPSTSIELSTAPNDSNDTNIPPSALNSASTSIATVIPKHPSTITAADGCVVLVSSEGDPFQLEMSNAVVLSSYVKNAIEGESSATGVIHCPHIKSSTLEKVVTFCKHNQTRPLTVFESALESCDIFALVDKWHLGFLGSFDRNQFWHLMTAAKILRIKPLFDLLCATGASAVNGKTPEQVRQILNPEDNTPFVTAETDADDPCYEYKWELSKSGGCRSKNLGKSSLRKINVSTRRDVEQESSLCRSSGEDLRDEDDDTSGFYAGETDLTTVLLHDTGNTHSATSGDSGTSKLASRENVAIAAGSGDLLGELNVDESVLAPDTSLTAGDSQLIDGGVELMEGNESISIVMDDESVGRDNSADANADGKENTVNMGKIRKREELDSGEDHSVVEDSNVNRRKSTHNVTAQPIDKSRASSYLDHYIDWLLNPGISITGLWMSRCIRQPSPLDTHENEVLNELPSVATDLVIDERPIPNSNITIPRPTYYSAWLSPSLGTIPENLQVLKVRLATIPENNVINEHNITTPTYYGLRGGLRGDPVLLTPDSIVETTASNRTSSLATIPEDEEHSETEVELPPAATSLGPQSDNFYFYEAAWIGNEHFHYFS